LYQFSERVMKLTVIIIMGYHCYQLHTKFHQMSFFQGKVHTKMKLLGTISVSFDLTDHLLIRFLHSSYTGEKWEFSETERQLFIEFKKIYDSVKREVLYSILIRIGIFMKLVRLNEKCFSET
jgi:hypothetical protein